MDDTTMISTETRNDEMVDGDGMVAERVSDEMAVNRSTVKESTDSTKKFRVLGLQWPGTWYLDPMLREMFDSCLNFHLWFDRNRDGMPKNGGISVTFESVTRAHEAFERLQKLNVDGSVLKLHASKAFYDCMAQSRHSATAVTIEETSATRNDEAHILHAINLTRSANEELLTALIGADHIESVQMVNVVDGSRQALISFVSSEAADEARLDVNGMEYDDGDCKRTVRLLTPSEYRQWFHWTEQEKLKAPSQIQIDQTPNIPCSMGNARSPTNTNIIAPELSTDQVVFAIEKHMEEAKVNFGELDKEEDLWALVDRVSNEQGGWPDSLSKVALLTVLDRKLALESVGWLRTHLDDLIRMWKRVVKSETNFIRPGQAVLAAPSYSPPTENRRRAGNKNRRTLVGMMSVGALLNTARTRFMTEDGELEIDEDEFGRTTIGGATLDWISWGALSGSANVPQAEEKKKTDSSQPVEQDEQQMLRRKRAGWQKERRKGAYKIRRLAFQRREQEEANETEKRPKPDQSIPVAKKEREEGEMSDQSSSSSSSSSDASDGEQKTKPAGHRQRRRQMRQMKVRPEMNNIQPQPQPQPQQQNVMMQQMLNFCQQFYDSRAGIVRQLSEEQKTALMTAMQQMQTMAQPFSVHQQQQMMDMMKSFMAQYHTPYHF